MNIQNVEHLFMFEVAKMLDAEETIAKGLEIMSQEVENRELKAALQRHKIQTEQQIENLQKIFESYELAPHPLENRVAKALTRDYQVAAFSVESPELRDLVTCLAAQKVEHQEIASYRGLIKLAQEIEGGKFVDLLKANLHQEQKMAKAMEDLTEKIMPVYA